MSWTLSGGSAGPRRLLHTARTRWAAVGPDRERSPLGSDGRMRPRPLPADLGCSFHVQDADRAGVPRRRLAARDVHAPFHGVRMIGAKTSSPDVRELCRAYLPRITGGQFFSHTTAAALWGMPLPFIPGDSIRVSANPPAREPRTRGIIGHRLRMPEDGLTLIEGFPVPTPAQTWAQLGGMLRADDLIAAGDWIIAHGDPLTDLIEDAITRSVSNSSGMPIDGAPSAMRGGGSSVFCFITSPIRGAPSSRPSDESSGLSSLVECPGNAARPDEMRCVRTLNSRGARRCSGALGECPGNAATRDEMRRVLDTHEVASPAHALDPPRATPRTRETPRKRERARPARCRTGPRARRPRVRSSGRCTRAGP